MCEGSLDDRVRLSTDEIRAAISGVQLKQSFLADTAAVYEKWGHEQAKNYIISKMKGEGETAGETSGLALLHVLDIIQKYCLPKTIAVFNVKKLQALQNYQPEAVETQ